MGRLGRFVVLAALISVGLLTAVTASGSRSKGTVSVPSIPAFTAAQDIAPSGNDWISINGNLWSWRYSTLSQINGTNGNSLKVAWSTTFAPPSPNPDANGILERPSTPAGNPLVYQCIVFVQDAWAHVDAIDGTTGNIVWSFDPKWSFQNQNVNGVGVKSVISLGDGMVFTGEGGTVYALDAKTGTQVWATQVVDPATGSLMSVPPVYYNGLLLDGVDGGDSGGPAYLVALNAKTGKPAWFFNTIPSTPKDPGWSSWPAKRAYWGGGGVWDPPTVDPATGMVYFGVANAIPFTAELSGPGRELWTESVLALHVMTGKFAWGYQEVHHDIWDYDANATPILASGTIGGKTRMFLWHVNKDNYDYTLDPLTGKPLLGVTETPVPQDPLEHTYPTQPIPDTQKPGSPDELVPHLPTQPQAWQGLDPNGNPFIFATQPFTPFDHTNYVVGPSTGLSWNEQAYSPKTGLVYLCDNQGEGATSSLPPADTHIIAGNSVLFGRLSASSPLYTGAAGHFIALNPTTQHIVWRQTTPGVNCNSQATVTAGGIALASRLDGTITAYDAATGTQDWVLQTGSTGIPRFGFYGANGKEYLAVSGTSNDSTAPNGIAYWLRGYALP